MRTTGLTLLVCALAFGPLSASPALAERWFGSVAANCDSFAECLATPDMPERPADSALFQFERSGKANAPVTMRVHVNKPVEGGVPITLAFGATAIELRPGADVLTRRIKGDDGTERIAGYTIADTRTLEILVAMRSASTGRMTIPVNGAPQELTIKLDGLDAALRFFDERQGRAGARDALVDPGTREPADAAVPKALPARTAWPKEIARLFRQHKCEDFIATFEDLTAGFIATPARGRELWQIACAGGNYNTHFLLIDIRNGDPKTARALTFPTRQRKRPDSVATNATWWDARKEIWAFERGRALGDCGTVARYSWTANGFKLAEEREKEDCDGVYDDPWTKWPASKPGRAVRR
jgi:hypothetical protein